jgi:plastocyanin
VRSAPLITRAALVAVLAALAFPSDGSAYSRAFSVTVTAFGPSPTRVTIEPTDRVFFHNQDSVTHTVNFHTDGSCSLNLSPGEVSACVGLWPRDIGNYPYTVDGMFGGVVTVEGFNRSISLTARTHTIRLGHQLRLHGQFTYEVDPDRYCPTGRGGDSADAVRVLARQNRSHPYRLIAMFPVRAHHTHVPVGDNGCTLPWHLTVRPGVRTTYIAEATGLAQFYKQAMSSPYTVLIRH